VRDAVRGCAACSHAARENCMLFLLTEGAISDNINVCVGLRSGTERSRPSVAWAHRMRPPPATGESRRPRNACAWSATRWRASCSASSSGRRVRTPVCRWRTIEPESSSYQVPGRCYSAGFGGREPGADQPQAGSQDALNRSAYARSRYGTLRSCTRRPTSRRRG